MDKIAVLIPCYNESQTIKKVVEDWKKELPEATIYVYDNNSSDNTAAIAREAGAVVRYEYQQGKGNVISSFFIKPILKFLVNAFTRLLFKGIREHVVKLDWSL